MKTREISQLFLSKSDKSFVRNCIYKNIIKFKEKNALQCMNIDRNINFSSTNFQMENDLISIFEEVCDKNLCSEIMSKQSKKRNATIIFLVACKIDIVAREKLTEDCYNWFLKSLLEKINSLLCSMTMFFDNDWNEYLLQKPDEPKSNIGETIIYTIIFLCSVNTFKMILKDVNS